MPRLHAGEVGEWYDTHARGLVLYARQWLDAGAAADVVQEAFVRLLRQKRRPESVRAWLYQVVRHAALDELRSRRRRRHREDTAGGGRDEWFNAAPGDALDAATAERLLSALPPEQREVIVLRVWGQLTLAEIGQNLGLATSTVFSRYEAGLAAMRKQMEPSPCRKNPS